WDSDGANCALCPHDSLRDLVWEPALRSPRWKRERINSAVPMVEAPGFEPGASCAQASRAISWKSFPFNRYFENKRLSRRNSSGRMYDNVAPHAWSPLTFPHSEITAKVFRPVPDRKLRCPNGIGNRCPYAVTVVLAEN